MKKLMISLAIATICGFCAVSETVTDYYNLKMSMLVPRTYDNMTSQGYRKYQRQMIKGELWITYDFSGENTPVVTITNLVNYTHKINGKPITYTCRVDENVMFPRVNLIGNNKTCKFVTPSVNFYLDAEPSYSVGEDDEDNSLLVTLAGRGTCAKKCGAQVILKLSGNAAGTLGCGCRAYGHTSPTRVGGACGASGMVDDVASTYGTWSARWVRRCWSK